MIPPSELRDSRIEEVEERDLVLQRVLERPTRGAVGGAGDRVVVCDQPRGGLRTGRGHRRVGAPRRHIAVAVQEESAVPSDRDLDAVGGFSDGPTENRRL